MIVVVAIILIPMVVAGMWLIYAGIATEPEEQRTTLNMASPNVMWKLIGNETYWDVEIRVNMVTPRDERIPWTELRVIVKAWNGSVLLMATSLAPDDPPKYDNGSDGTVDVQAWYVETTIGDADVDKGDSLFLTGLTTDYEGAVIEILRSGERIGSVKMPTNFP